MNDLLNQIKTEWDSFPDNFQVVVSVKELKDLVQELGSKNE